jgi:hypothetical protein
MDTTMPTPIGYMVSLSESIHNFVHGMNAKLHEYTPLISPNYCNGGLFLQFRERYLMDISP